MQLTGDMFSEVAALAGNDLATFPISLQRSAPRRTLLPAFPVPDAYGQFQDLHYRRPGGCSDCDEPASLKSNLKWAKKGATILTDTDAFDEKTIEKAGYKKDPLEDHSSTVSI